MESIAPPLRLLLVIRRHLEKGNSVKMGLNQYLQNENDEFLQQVAKWYSLCQQGLGTQDFLRTVKSFRRRLLLQLLERGMRGEPIYASLCQMEVEIADACYEEIADRLARLPFLMMIPLLLMQFPAILMLLFGPLLQNFFHSLGGG